MDRPECKGRASTWPIALALKLTSGGSDLANQIEIDPAASTGGGEYEGDDVYTWMAADLKPVPGKVYQIDARSVGRNSALSAANPHLVVSAAGAPGLLEGIALNQAMALLVGVILVASTSIWAIIISRRRRQR